MPPAPAPPPPDTSEKFAEGYRRHQAGDLVAAERIYREILAVEPAHTDSLRMLAMVATQARRHEEAIALASRAVQAAPVSPAVHLAHAVTLQEAGRMAEAVASYDRVLAADPGMPTALYGRALALQELGQLEAAIAGYQAALALRPDFAEALNNLGNSLLAVGRRNEAEVAYRRAIAVRPDHVDAYYNLGVSLQAMERHGEAVETYRRTLALRPNYEPALVNLGASLRAVADPEAAIDVLRRALALKPDRPDTYANLANALQELGRTAEAREVVAKALAVCPTSAELWIIHAGLKTFAPGDPEFGRMEAVLAGLKGQELTSEANLEFALGKAWMDVGAAAPAFAHLTRANQLKRADIDYDIGADVRRLASIATGAAALRRRVTGTGHPSELPVFIVGMPRSGTTLVEQILASHPDVHGAGELPAFAEEAARALAAAGASPGGLELAPGDSRIDPATLGAAYLERVAALAGGKARLVDKMPGNFQNLGLISMALPNARIIHCRRDPVDTCLSCYATRFVSGQPFAYDLAELGQYYRAYAALMDHWRATLPPDRFLEVRYEDVVGDLEGQARRMIAFIGLGWDPAMLSFHETRRPVRTASVNQVRQPLYATSRGRWRPYEAHLQPLLAALGDLAPPAGGAVLPDLESANAPRA